MRSPNVTTEKRYRWLQRAHRQLTKVALAFSILAITMAIIVGPYTQAGQHLSHHINHIVASIAPVTTSDDGGGTSRQIIADVASHHSTPAAPSAPPRKTPV
ncbi:hypothetical protein LMG33810_000219 [Carnimonas sp. LMG 33810]